MRVHDFKDPGLGKAIPYGVYDLAANNGWVSVGVDHDTACSPRPRCGAGGSGWGARRTDAGGSNSPTGRLWKLELQRFADATGLEAWVSHFPPGTSKWNKIEHRMFCWITENWRGRPLVSREAAVEPIANTTTEKGLTIQAELDENEYPLGVKVSDQEMATANIRHRRFHGEWNHVIRPNGKR